MLVILSACLGASGGSAAPAGASSPFPGSNSKEPISIEADKLEYFNKEGRAIYTGNVVAVQGDTTMKCAKLYITLERQQAKAGEAKSDSTMPGSSGVKHMDMDGPVTLYSKDQVGVGDRGEYDKPQNKAFLYGHVVMTQNGNITKGDKLTYDMTTGEATVESDAGNSTRVSGYFLPDKGQESKPTEPKSTEAKSPPKAPPTKTTKKGSGKKKVEVNG